MLLPAKIFSYAAGTAVIASGNKWEQLYKNNDLSKISDWIANNKICRSIKKTVYLNFGSYYDSSPYNLQIQINNSPIEQKISAKYLGIIFGSKLKWNLHIKYILVKTRYLPFFFYKLLGATETFKNHLLCLFS